MLELSVILIIFINDNGRLADPAGAHLLSSRTTNTLALEVPNSGVTSHLVIRTAKTLHGGAQNAHLIPIQAIGARVKRRRSMAVPLRST